MRLVVGPRRQFRPAGPIDVLMMQAPSTDESPAVVGDGRRLALQFNDIAEPRPGLVAPDAAVMAAILDFGRAAEDLAVLCYAGVSRSTAAAYALACQATPPGQERALARDLRRLSPAATPNPLMVALADDALGREGRMVDAVAAIGRGADAFEGPLFTWRIDAAPAGN